MPFFLVNPHDGSNTVRIIEATSQWEAVAEVSGIDPRENVGEGRATPAYQIADSHRGFATLDEARRACENAGERYL